MMVDRDSKSGGCQVAVLNDGHHREDYSAVPVLGLKSRRRRRFTCRIFITNVGHGKISRKIWRRWSKGGATIQANTLAPDIISTTVLVQSIDR